MNTYDKQCNEHLNIYFTIVNTTLCFNFLAMNKSITISPFACVPLSILYMPPQPKIFHQMSFAMEFPLTDIWRLKNIHIPNKIKMYAFREQYSGILPPYMQDELCQHFIILKFNLFILKFNIIQTNIITSTRNLLLFTETKQSSNGIFE